MTKKNKHGQAVRKTNQKSTQGQKTANKPIKSNKSVHKSTKSKSAQNKPKLSKKKEGAIHRLIVVLGLVRDKKKENVTRKNMDLKKEHPRFPFWARFLGDKKKHRTTLVIDEEMTTDKVSKQLVEGYVHREVISKYKGGREEIKPNPDKDKRPNPMYLKRATKAPKAQFIPHNKNLEMPKQLKDKYDKNNYK